VVLTLIIIIIIIKIIYLDNNFSGKYCCIIWLKTDRTIRGSGLLGPGLARGNCITYFNVFTPLVSELQLLVMK